MIDLGFLNALNDLRETKWTAFLFRDLLMQYIYPVKITTQLLLMIPETTTIDIYALLEQALPLMNSQVMTSRYTPNIAGPFEYVIRELYATFCGILNNTSYNVFSEAKDRKKLGQRCIDILFNNSEHIIFEFKVKAITTKTINKEMKQVQKYANQLSQESYRIVLLNFVFDIDRMSLPSKHEEMFPNNENVTTFHIIFDESWSKLFILCCSSSTDYIIKQVL